MTRKFKTPDYEAMLHSTISLADALPEGHLARFVVEVITQLDLGSIYRRYAPVGGEAIAPEILLGLLFYGYATGVFSSRKIERAPHESLPFRFTARGCIRIMTPSPRFARVSWPSSKSYLCNCCCWPRRWGC